MPHQADTAVVPIMPIEVRRHTIPTSRPSMYLQHWGLHKSPFATIAYSARPYAGDAAPYPTRPLVEATARADYLVSQRRRVGALLGGHGWGKTTTAAAIATEQRRNGAQVVLLDAGGLTSREMLFRIAEGLAAEPDAADCQMRLWRRIEDALAENRWQERSTILVIDDAEQLGPDSQAQVVRLARLEAEATSRWTILLSTSPESLEKLSLPLLHLIDLRIDLALWSFEDALGYLQSALVEAGRYEPIFTEQALEQLHSLTRGVPRHVVRLADFALLAGAVCDSAQVGVDLVEQAFAETKWAPRGMAVAS